jgi:hypothetical protein
MHLLPHYLKVSVRNLRRYPMQTLISVIGLAAGFVCLSLSALWLHYENTYNTSLPDADRLYVMDCSNAGVNALTPGGFLMKYNEMPEVECATLIFINNVTLSGGQEVRMLLTDNSFAQMFDVKIVAGDDNFFYPPSNTSFFFGHGKDKSIGIAISSSLAYRLFGDENPLGQIVSWSPFSSFSARYPVNAVFDDMDPHTDIYADMIFVESPSYQQGNWSIYVTKLRPGSAVFNSFCAKADAHVEWEGGEPSHLKPIHFTDIHRLGLTPNASLSYAHLQAFLLVSILLVVCALANFLTFWLNRLRGRMREMALRRIHGANGRNLVGMLCCELLLVMLLACALGMTAIAVLQKPFCTYADIATAGFVLSRSLVFMAATLVVCFLVSLVAVVVLKNRTARQSITPSRISGHRFMSVSTGVQLAIGLCFVFCCIIMLRQLRYMRDYDWGVRYKDVGSFQFDGKKIDSNFGTELYTMEMLDNILRGDALCERAKAFTGIQEILDKGGWMLSDHWSLNGVSLRLNEIDNPVNTHFFKGVFDPGHPVYGFTVLEGELPRKEHWQPGQLVITEQVRKELGLEQAVGQTVKYGDNFDGIVVCVIRDISWKQVRQNDHSRFSSLALRPPVESDYTQYQSNSFYFTYKPGQKEAIVEQFREALKDHPEAMWHVEFGDELFARLIQSELNLSRLLTTIAAVCILIALFGIYSIVTLACRQRRREIAIRKVYGAEQSNIVALFVRQYGFILLVSTVAAFATGYLIMHRWLEQYVQRTDMPWWLYVVLFLGAVLLITLCAGNRLLRTARENPADVVKSE